MTMFTNLLDTITVEEHLSQGLFLLSAKDPEVAYHNYSQSYYMCQLIYHSTHITYILDPRYTATVTGFFM